LTLDDQPLNRAPVNPAHYRPVVAWLQAHTPTNAVLLASISESPVFWAHTGRPIVLHSKFENQRIRERYREFLGALYGTEEQLYAFARRYGADYFIYDRACLVTGKDTWRYKADKLGPLPADCPAVSFATGASGTTRFARVYDTERYVVYRVPR
jgi:hypothetical protein